MTIPDTNQNGKIKAQTREISLYIYIYKDDNPIAVRLSKEVHS